MSFRAMLKHRASVLRLEETSQNGYPVHEWATVTTRLACFLDLNFLRAGKDPMWTPEAGRPSDRTGVLFTQPDADIRSGDRVVMMKGPEGTFEIEGAVDEAWRPTNRHHLELGVKEVAKMLTGEAGG